MISARRDLRAQRGGEHRGARRKIRAEEQTEERITISARHDLRARCGKEHRGARHDSVRYHSLVMFCSSVFIRVVFSYLILTQTQSALYFVQYGFVPGTDLLVSEV